MIQDLVFKFSDAKLVNTPCRLVYTCFGWFKYSEAAFKICANLVKFCPTALLSPICIADLQTFMPFHDISRSSIGKVFCSHKFHIRFDMNEIFFIAFA